MTEADGVGSDEEHTDDAAYFRRRAEWHRHRADVAHDSATRTLHRKFANLYAARADD